MLIFNFNLKKMGKEAFQYALTEKQRRSLILSELIPDPNIIQLILNFASEHEFLDAQAEHLELRDESHYDSTTPITFPVPISAAEWRAMKFHVCIDIHVFQPGFMMMYVPPVPTHAGWFPHLGPNLALKDIPGMRQMSVKNSISVLKELYAQKQHRVVENSLYHYNRGQAGSTDDGDYGGIYYETDNPDHPVAGQDINFVIL